MKILQKYISSRRWLCELETCTFNSLPQDFKLLVLVHIWTTFPMVENIAGLLSQIVRKLCHCIQTSLALQPAPGNPPEPWFSFSIPLICPPLFNNQPLSFFSSRRVHLSQIAHGRSPICKSICPPSSSISHIHCTCTPHLLCVLNSQSSLCLSQMFLGESLSLTPRRVDVENSHL